jgi:histidinol phosphatase-like PHP family hydrolase
VQGYRGLAICDHCDQSNYEEVARRVRQFCERGRGHYGQMQLLAGCELTHVPPEQIREYVEAARQAGAQVVIVHGETLVEPVAPGTNRAAIEAGADVLAHPGLVDGADVELAAENRVLLELSGRKGHSFTNGHVARLASECGADLSFGSDGHQPGDYPTGEKARLILRGAGLNEAEVDRVFSNARTIFNRCHRRG